MKKILILFTICALFTVFSCKKDEGIRTANATFTFHKMVCLAVCCSAYDFQIDNLPGVSYKSTKIPDGFQIPDQDVYTARVYIEYKPYKHPGGCENFIEIIKMSKVE